MITVKNAVDNCSVPTVVTSYFTVILNDVSFSKSPSVVNTYNNIPATVSLVPLTFANVPMTGLTSGQKITIVISFKYGCTSNQG